MISVLGAMFEMGVTLIFYKYLLQVRFLVLLWFYVFHLNLYFHLEVSSTEMTDTFFLFLNIVVIWFSQHFMLNNQ